VDAVTTRIGRARPEAQELAAIWSVLTTETPSGGVDLAVRALPIEIDPDLAQRALRSGGLVDGSGNLIPLVKAAILTDLTARRRAALHDRLAGALADDDPIAAARHLLAGQGELPAAPQILARAALRLASSQPQEAETFIARAQQLGLPPPEAALLHALSAFHLGSPDALIHLEQARSGEGGSVDDRASLLGFGIDLRDLRFEAASQRPIGGELAQPLLSIAKGLGGQVAAPEPQPNRTPIGQMVAAMATGLAALAEGNAGEALGELSTAADDFDRLRPTAPFGITPHSLGSLAALTVGDLTAVEIFTEQALNHASGGPGEDLTHKLIRAYGQLVDGQYGDALAILRDRAALGADGGGEPDRAGTGFDSPEAVGSGPRSSGLLAQRDRLLLAALEASIARRSGDTGRLRAAWKRAEDALIRPSVSWLLNDFFVELLAAGARLGDTRRVEPVLEELVAQGLSLPGSGPGPVGAHWLRLQCALASEDSETVIDAAEQLAGLDPSDDRSRARVAAAGIWVQVMAAEATEEAVVEVAERLSAVGDGWEASRLLGQAALDEEDPRAARRMLELARTSATEHVDESSGEGLSALGLSEREAEVALLVAEGRTHKEIGAQLFISPKTVEHHVAKIRQKLGAGSRAELLAIIRDAAETH
jgi:DNA-binding CsgD family transcriptional regulator